ncbi:hypothetical protein [Tissierella sp.]|uniref:hypothetical protein n=1 Tax=Tissierella sp. TaxID=41274 RepID=UPI00285F8359|nr:hypothetical protein [Tissierella sp.]MDR7854995.1 hypothetical protein [Tissierella sp.]
MKERLKTFLLISMVVITLVLTKKLWIELPNAISDIFSNREEAYSVSYLLSDMIIPNKYMLNFNENNHTFFYDDSSYGLWTNNRRTISNILGSKTIKTLDLSNDEFLTYDRKRSIIFYFPEKVNTYILAKALDVKDPNTIVDILPSVKSIYIYLGNEDPFFVLSDSEKNIAIYDQSIDVDKLKEQVLEIEEKKDHNYFFSMKEKYGINNEVYVPYEMQNNLPQIYVENEIRNLDDGEKKQMAEKFFNKDIDYIREIEESNGSTIYLYDQRVLKLNVNGTLEYFHSLEDIIKKRNLYESLSTSAEFISQKAGVTKGMYLSNIEDIEVDNNLGYRLSFKYRIRGIPVILGNEEVEGFVEIEVFNEHIRSYKHFIRKDMNKTVDNIIDGKKMLTSYKVIDMNYDFFTELYLEKNGIVLSEGQGLPPSEEVLSIIQDVTLSYFDPCLKDIEDELIGVWAIRTVDNLYAFDVYNGSLVYEKSQN